MPVARSNLRCEEDPVDPTLFMVDGKSSMDVVELFRIGVVAIVVDAMDAPVVAVDAGMAAPECPSSTSAAIRRLVRLLRGNGRVAVGLCRRLPLRRKDLAVRAEIKMTMPTICSKVHSLSKRRKERNNVVALRAVDVMDMVKAPKFLVMAAEQEEPKNPMALNNCRRHVVGERVCTYRVGTLDTTYDFADTTHVAKYLPQ